MQEVSTVKKNFINYINKIVANKKIFHTYLIELNDYESDFSYVLDFIKMILNDVSYEELDKVDSNINKLIDTNNYPDLVIVEPEENVIRKKQLLDIKKEFNNTSLLENKRIYVIKHAEKLNGASANTMLKFLEEPEDNIIAFLITNNRYQVIDTILSRCQVLSLKDNIEVIVNEELIDLLKCIIDPKSFFVKYKYYYSNVIKDKYEAKEKLEELERIIISYLDNKYCDNILVSEEVNKLLDGVDNKELLNKIAIIEEELKKTEYNINYKLWLDSLFSKLEMEVK